MTSVFCHKVMSTVLISQYRDESLHLEFRWERNLAKINNCYCYRSRNNLCWWCDYQHSGGIWCIHVVCRIYLWNVCNYVQNDTVTWSRRSTKLHCHMIQKINKTMLSRDPEDQQNYTVTWSRRSTKLRCHVIQKINKTMLSHDLEDQQNYAVTWSRRPTKLHCHMIHKINISNFLCHEKPTNRIFICIFLKLQPVL